MANDRTILITGVTGQQCGAVARALQGAGLDLRGLTRKPDSEPAAALARRDIDKAHGKRLATLGRNTGVEHYVYTSVGSANKRTGVPPFDNKW